jgi:hypothetical protein
MILLSKHLKKRQARKNEEREGSEKIAESLETSEQQQDQTDALPDPEIKEAQVKHETHDGPTALTCASANIAPSKKDKKKSKPIETEEEKLVNKRRRAYRWKLMISLFPPAFLAAVDVTIVATATTTIASHFSKFLLHVISFSIEAFNNSKQINSTNLIGL